MAVITPIPYDATKSEEIHLTDYLYVVLESWRSILIVVLTISCLGALYATIAQPVYRADVMIQIETNADASSPSDTQALGQLAAIFDTKAKATADAEMELIRSRLVVGGAVKQLGLDVTVEPRYFPVVGQWVARLYDDVGPANAFLGLRSFAWGGEHIDVSLFKVPAGLFERKFLIIAQPDASFDLIGPDGQMLGHGRVGQELTASLGHETIRLLISKLTARANTEFTLVADSPLQTIQRVQEALAISEKTKQSGVVGLSLDGTNPALIADVVNAVAEQYVAQDVARRSADAEHSLSFLDEQLPKLRHEMEGAEERYNAFRNSKGTVDLSTESRLLLQQMVDRENVTNNLLGEREDLNHRYRDGFPQLEALNAKIALSQQEQDALSKRIAALPDTEQTALRLMRDVQVNTQLYTNLLNSAQQLRVVKAGHAGNVRVVDYAIAPEKPVKPKWKMVVALSALVGLGAGVAYAFLRRALYGGVERSDEMERALGVGVCAVVPHSSKQLRLKEKARRGVPGPHVLAILAPNDAAIEGMRSLRTALHSFDNIASNNIVMITGSRPGVGKSFMAVNLAAVMAAGGKRVLLIDADMRQGNLHASFNAYRNPGLCELLGGADVEDVLIRNVAQGVDLIPRGEMPENPADLLMSPRLKDVLGRVSTLYDAVVIDTPPVLAVTDASLIGQFAGTTLLVARHGRHSIPEMAETIKRLRHSGVSIGGILFTDVPSRKIGYHNGYEDSYNYDKNINQERHAKWLSDHRV
ncbi:polysaccharide biosynthesis tyrosine autokinase [Paraburkholderia sediminicola]|uniref:polysaccharide biosynthesis tyrosine autokinase n=1 Tax=Paraburkholderia sediminicola TaxID=458836 RepID=UPI0038B99A3F